MSSAPALAVQPPRAPAPLRHVGPMIVGFTGTRRGMSAAQHAACARLLDELQPTAVHHGDAIGADAEFHALARQLGIRIEVHPATTAAHRAFCTGNVVHRPRSKAARDRAVVNACDLLVATPADPDLEGPTAGTWYTVQYALWCERPIVLIWPDGTREDGAPLARGHATSTRDR